MAIANPYVKSRQKRQPKAYPRVCGWCNTEFTASHNDTRFCSRYCREAHWRSEHPEKITRLITDKMVREEESKLKHHTYTRAPRPLFGACCSHPKCGKVLYGYEKDWGVCLKHKQDSLHIVGEPVYLTEEKVRTRTLINYHAAQAGD
jgi:hypothetical protein